MMYGCKLTSPYGCKRPCCAFCEGERDCECSCRLDPAECEELIEAEEFKCIACDYGKENCCIGCYEEFDKEQEWD